MELPEVFILKMKTLLGSEWSAFEQALQEESPVSVRINPRKNHCFIAQNQPVPWASHACYLTSRPSFTLDPLFHAGCYYVQEASSMFLEQILKNQLSQPVKVLDLCAAPGGKSTQLITVLPEGSLLVANEVIRSRALVLSENLIKWGYPDFVITNNDPADIGKLTDFFDAIVADVPCSGEGMFRKDPTAIREWSANHVKLCVERQRRIIADSWTALSPGGLLIYSTCTYNREENEDNIAWICRELGADPVEDPRRFMPHTTQGEGFFIAAVRKKGKTGAKAIVRKIKNNFPETVLNRIIRPADFVVFPEKHVLIAFPKKYAEDYVFLKKHLKVLSAGILLGEWKGKEVAPVHGLAMSTARAMDAFPVWDLNKETALQYLRKEALQEIPADLPKGYAGVAYSGQILGWVKNIGSRANNLYPSEWRIRKF